MKRYVQILLLQGMIFLWVVLAGHAQTVSALHSFNGAAEGAYPQTGLISSGETLYGTTSSTGGAFDVTQGTVFRVNTDGTAFRVLHNFFRDGNGQPMGELLLAGNTLYGTTTSGGLWTNGAVFMVNTDGTGFTNLYSFTGGSDGAKPSGRLVLSGSTLYGTTQFGGTNGSGTVFALNTDGTHFKTLHSFAAVNYIPGQLYPFSNSDGYSPWAGLTLSSNTLYGTTQYGGTLDGNGTGLGTIFRLNFDGTDFATLHVFGLNDGAGPRGAMILSGDTLYGTTSSLTTDSALNIKGTVFRLNTDGTDFATLLTFPGTGTSAELAFWGTSLYGTMPESTGGPSGEGSIFKLNSDGTGFTNLFYFPGINPIVLSNSVGVAPHAGLILSDNRLYGTAYGGGSFSYGTVFSCAMPGPSQLGITWSPGNIILVWQTNEGNFTLQSTTNLASPTWTTNVPAPLLVSGQYTVTNPISGSQQFFRLVQP